MSRRLRLARQKKAAKTIVIQIPQTLDPQQGLAVRRRAEKYCPGRNILVLTGGATAVEV